MEPHEAVAGGCETEVGVTFLALGFRCTFASWYLASPFLFIHDHPVGCGIWMHIRDRNRCSGSSSRLFFILPSNCGTGTTSLPLQILATFAQAFCNIRLERIKPDLFLFSHPSAAAVSLVEQPDSHNGHVDKVEHQPVVPLLRPDFVAVQCNERVQQIYSTHILIVLSHHSRTGNFDDFFFCLTSHLSTSVTRCAPM